MTFAVYIIGHFGEDLKNINTIVTSAVLPYITKAVYFVMPNLSALDVKSAVVQKKRAGSYLPRGGCRRAK